MIFKNIKLTFLMVLFFLKAAELVAQSESDFYNPPKTNKTMTNNKNYKDVFSKMGNELISQMKCFKEPGFKNNESYQI